jgi:hypothetical protein
MIRVVAISEVIERIALRRVHDGDVVLLGERWLCNGRPVASYLPDAFDELVTTGLIAMSTADSVTPVLRAALTTAGAARYSALLEQVRLPRGVRRVRSA